MPKDIDEILDGLVVPEMSYSPEYDTGSKRKTKSGSAVAATSDEVPEVVLPKTKAEVYREAKGRLTQKTTAVSKNKSAARKASHKTVEPELASVSRELDSAQAERLKLRKGRLDKQKKAEPVWVGDESELVPFAWRKPLVPVERSNKIYKSAVRDALMLPEPKA